MTMVEILNRYDEAVASFAAGLVAGSLDKHMEEGYREQYELFKAGRDAIRAQLVPNEPLTLDELRKMNEEIAWCAELECWGIIVVEKGGMWDGIPFLLGYKGCQFQYDIVARKLTLYRQKPVSSNENTEKGNC